MRARRVELTSEQRTAAARKMRNHLLASPFMRDIPHVLCYCSHRGEMDTMQLIRALLAEGRSVSVPMVVGHSVMHAHRITSCDDLVPGKFGILVPAKPDPVDTSPQVSLCPGFAFTERGDRVGSGYGYYDRYLAAHPEVTAIALAYDFQLVPELPTDPMDQRMRYIVTDQRVIDCGT